MLKKALRSILAIVLATVMTFSVIATTIASEFAEKSNDNEINYVSIGASNTNGYGVYGYLPTSVHEDPLAASKANLNVYGYLQTPEDAYPAQVKAALQAANPDKEVNLYQLAISSMRTEEVRYLLDESYAPDAYMNWRFTGGQKWFEIAEPGGIPALRAAYTKYIAEADIISIDIGWNNFGVYAFNNIKSILTGGNYWKAPDFSLIEDVAQYQMLKAVALAKLSEKIGDENPEIRAKLDLMTDVLVYATLGSCESYDVIVEKIYELNADAKVIVVNIQNLADELVVQFDGDELPIGDIYGELIDIVNIYRAGYSPYADRTLFADTGDVETFLDEFCAWDGDPKTLGRDTKDCFDMYDDNLYVRSIVEYLMVGQVLSGTFATFKEQFKPLEAYGIEIFKNDDAYTYDFALTRTTEELLSLDLSGLDFNNPEGSDMDIELYGKALSKHLQNLRKGNFGAYDYVFDNVIAAITGTPLESYASVIAEAKAQFKMVLGGIYVTYNNTLDYAYDVVATILQHVARMNSLELGSDMSGFGSAESQLLGYVANSFINGAMQKFYFELQANGIQNTGVTQDPEFVLDESIFDSAAIRAIAILAVRYELGNSFFAHPSTKGHDQIADAIVDALNNNTSGKTFTLKKEAEYNEFIAEHTYPATHGEYDVTCESYYVSLGDATALGASAGAAFADKLAEKLGLDTDKNSEDVQFIQLALAGLRTNDLRYILDETFTPDEYFNGEVLELINNYAGSLEALREIYREELAKADLVTLSIGYGNLTSAQKSGVIANWARNDAVINEWIGNRYFGPAIKEALAGFGIDIEAPYYTPDWDSYLTEDMQDKLFEYIDELTLSLTENGVPEIYTIDIGVMLDLPLAEGTIVVTVPVADIIGQYIEWYVYGCVSHISSYGPVLDELYEMTSDDAEIVVLSMYNPVGELKIGEGEDAIDFGEYLDMMISIMNANSFVSVMSSSDNTTYIDIEGVETGMSSAGSTANSDLMGFVSSFMFSSDSDYSAFNPTDKGHLYIADKIYDGLTVANSKHNYTAEVTAPTCTADGYTTFVCSCGETYVGDYVDAAGHSYGEWTEVTAPTCTAEGSARRDCANCDHYETKAVEALGHDEVAHDAKAPTCTEIGYEAYVTCSRCDYTTYKEIPASGHTEDAAVTENSVDATCTAEGSYDTVVYCAVCKVELSRVTTTVDAAGHSFDDWYEVTAPTCTTEGSARRDCANCDHYETKAVEALGHDEVAHEAKAPTCTEIGWGAYITCNRCDYTTYVEMASLGHDFADEWTVDFEATTEAFGQKSRHCSRCDEVTDIIEIAKLVEIIDSSKKFIDVSATSWAKPGIDYVVSYGYMNGTGNGTTFSPTGTMSRSMIVTVLYRIAGQPDHSGNNPFTDIETGWYYDAVLWAYENGIVTGTSATTFAPNGDVTREQMATFLYRFAGYMGYSTDSKADLSIFPDESKVGAWAYDALAWANAEKLITGAKGSDGVTTLNPQGAATREQVATILMRFCNTFGVN